MNPSHFMPRQQSNAFELYCNTESVEILQQKYVETLSEAQKQDFQTRLMSYRLQIEFVVTNKSTLERVVYSDEIGNMVHILLKSICDFEIENETTAIHYLSPIIFMMQYQNEILIINNIEPAIGPEYSDVIKEVKLMKVSRNRLYRTLYALAMQAFTLVDLIDPEYWKRASGGPVCEYIKTVKQIFSESNLELEI